MRELQRLIKIKEDFDKCGFPKMEDLSGRSINCLVHLRLVNPKLLISLHPLHLLRQRRFGKKTYLEIMSHLEKNGFNIGAHQHMLNLFKEKLVMQGSVDSVRIKKVLDKIDTPNSKDLENFNYYQMTNNESYLTDILNRESK